jgi:hypothetical protein
VTGEASEEEEVGGVGTRVGCGGDEGDVEEEVVPEEEEDVEDEV